MGVLRSEGVKCFALQNQIDLHKLIDVLSGNFVELARFLLLGGSLLGWRGFLALHYQYSNKIFIFD
jgi:hypothetical protein